jgi:hypothetical protein
MLYEDFTNRGDRPFDVYAGENLLYPWAKAWKELRRNRKLTLRQGMCAYRGMLAWILYATDKAHRDTPSCRVAAPNATASACGHPANVNASSNWVGSSPGPACYPESSRDGRNSSRYSRLPEHFIEPQPACNQ